MKHLSSIYLILFLCFVAFPQKVQSQNLYSWGGLGNDAISALAPTEDAGRIGLLYYEQSCTVGDSSYQSAGSNDFLLIRWDALREVEWIVPISSSSALSLEAFEADSTGAGYAIFQSSNSQSWAGQITAAPDYSSILYAWDAQGQLRWTYAWESPLFQRFSSLDFDANSVYVGGYFSNDLNCLDSSWAAAGIESPFVARLSSAGTFLWGSTLPHKVNATAQIKALALLNGYCYVAGDLVDSLFLPLDTLYAAGADPDLFLLRYDSLGQVVQSQGFHGILSDRVGQLEADASKGKLYLAGEMQGQLRLGTHVLLTAIPAYDAFIAQIDSSGQVDWAKKLYAEANNYSSAIAARQGRIWQTGHFLDSFWVEGQSLQAQAGFDGYVVVWDSLGQLQQAISLSGSGAILPEAIISESLENWVVGGSFGQTWQGNNALGGSDAFLFEGDVQLSRTEKPLAPIIDLPPFPNPTTDTVRLPLDEYRLLYWELFDMSGKLLKRGKSPLVDLRELPTALYSIFIHLEQGIAIEKIQRK